jgi:acyl carrier protein
MDCYPWIRGIIAKELAMDEKDVVPEAHLLDDLGADSLALVTLAEAISARYGIELVADDLVEMENVGELIKLVESRVSVKA